MDQDKWVEDQPNANNSTICGNQYMQVDDKPNINNPMIRRNQYVSYMPSPWNEPLTNLRASLA